MCFQVKFQGLHGPRNRVPSKCRFEAILLRAQHASVPQFKCTEHPSLDVQRFYENVTRGGPRDCPATEIPGHVFWPCQGFGFEIEFFKVFGIEVGLNASTQELIEVTRVTFRGIDPQRRFEAMSIGIYQGCGGQDRRDRRANKLLFCCYKSHEVDRRSTSARGVPSKRGQ